MKVLWAMSAYKPALDYGGPIHKTSLLAPELQNLGVELEIVTANFGMDRTEIPAGRRLVDGVPVNYLPRLVSRGWLSLTRGTRAAMGKDFDILHVFGLRDGVGTTASILSRHLGLPFVVEPMGMAVPAVRNVRGKRIFDGSIGRINSRAAATIATSEAEASQLKSLGFPNVHVRVNPIEPATDRRRPERPRYDICYVGRLHEKKRLGDILKAVASGPWTAIIAGPDEDGTGASLRNQAAQLGVADRVEFRAWVDANERRAIVSSSRSFVMPSLTENWGNGVAEAVAMGVPVVVTKTCGVAELVRECGAGVVVAPRTEAVVAGVRALLAHDGPRHNRAIPDRFTPANVAATQLRIYRLLVSEAAGGRQNSRPSAHS